MISYNRLLVIAFILSFASCALQDLLIGLFELKIPYLTLITFYLFVPLFGYQIITLTSFVSLIFFVIFLLKFSLQGIEQEFSKVIILCVNTAICISLAQRADLKVMLHYFYRYRQSLLSVIVIQFFTWLFLSDYRNVSYFFPLLVYYCCLSDNEKIGKILFYIFLPFSKVLYVAIFLFTLIAERFPRRLSSISLPVIFILYFFTALVLVKQLDDNFAEGRGLLFYSMYFSFGERLLEIAALNNTGEALSSIFGLPLGWTIIPSGNDERGYIHFGVYWWIKSFGIFLLFIAPIFLRYLRLNRKEFILVYCLAVSQCLIFSLGIDPFVTVVIFLGYFESWKRNMSAA